MNIEFEGIDPHDFDLESFQREVEQELHRMLVPQGEQVVTTAFCKIAPPRSLLIRLQLHLERHSGKYICAAFGIILGFVLGRQTPISFSNVLNALAVLGGLLLITKLIAIYERRRADREWKIAQERRRAEEAAKFRISQLKAEAIVEKPGIKKLLCPVLKSVTNDAFEISKVVTPVLTGAVIVGTISIPLNSVLFAAIGLVIARSGINSLCADYK